MTTLTSAPPMQPVRLEPAEVAGTVGGLWTAARRAGFETQCWTGFGVRLPKLAAQAYRWQAWTTLYGRHEDGRAFMARNDDEGWQVTIVKPGWPRMAGTTTSLRAMLKASAA